MESIMTTKKTSKPAAQKAAAYVPTQSHITLAAQVGLNVSGVLTAKAAAQKAVEELHKAKAVIGDARTCPLAQAFLDKRFSGKAKVSAGSKANALSAFRKAVATGKEYNENAGRVKAKAKGAKAGGGTIMIAIPSGAKAEDAAAKLRAGFEKLRAANDDLAALAAFLVDALDDAGFPESDE
jgi:hypothetical protein